MVGRLRVRVRVRVWWGIDIAAELLVQTSSLWPVTSDYAGHALQRPWPVAKGKLSELVSPMLPTTSQPSCGMTDLGQNNGIQ